MKSIFLLVLASLLLACLPEETADTYSGSITVSGRIVGVPYSSEFNTDSDYKLTTFHAGNERIEFSYGDDGSYQSEVDLKRYFNNIFFLMANTITVKDLFSYNGDAKLNTQYNANQLITKKSYGHGSVFYFDVMIDSIFMASPVRLDRSWDYEYIDNLYLSQYEYFKKMVSMLTGRVLKFSHVVKSFIYDDTYRVKTINTQITDNNNQSVESKVTEEVSYDDFSSTVTLESNDGGQTILYFDEYDRLYKKKRVPSAGEYAEIYEMAFDNTVDYTIKEYVEYQISLSDEQPSYSPARKYEFSYTDDRLTRITKYGLIAPDALEWTAKDKAIIRYNMPDEIDRTTDTYWYIYDFIIRHIVPAEFRRCGLGDENHKAAYGYVVDDGGFQTEKLLACNYIAYLQNQ